jgi:hypothetical protein
LPEGDEAKTKFIDEIRTEIFKGVGPKLDILYAAVSKVSKRLKLIRTFKGFRKLKFHWKKEDYDSYKGMLNEA